MAVVQFETVQTKIELVTEAIEGLVLATTVAHATPHNAHVHRQNIESARADVHRALLKLLTPVARVYSQDVIAAPDARPAYPVA